MPNRVKPTKPLGKASDVKRPKGKPRGRNGGRKPSAATTRSKKIADEIAKGERYVLEEGDPLPEDASPLDIMLCAMRTAYRKRGPEAASVYAEKCAPYIHSRIAQMTLKGVGDAPIRLVFAWASESLDTGGI